MEQEGWIRMRIIPLPEWMEMDSRDSRYTSGAFFLPHSFGRTVRGIAQFPLLSSTQSCQALGGDLLLHSNRNRPKIQSRLSACSTVSNPSYLFLNPGQRKEGCSSLFPLFSWFQAHETETSERKLSGYAQKRSLVTPLPRQTKPHVLYLTRRVHLPFQNGEG